jgi:hypothetical protein
VDGHQAHVELGGFLDRPGDRDRDVVELEIEHDLVALAAQGAHRVGAVGAEQLEPHLDHADRRPGQLGPVQGEVEVGGVQGEHHGRGGLPAVLVVGSLPFEDDAGHAHLSGWNSAGSSATEPMPWVSR